MLRIILYPYVLVSYIFLECPQGCQLFGVLTNIEVLYGPFVVYTRDAVPGVKTTDGIFLGITALDNKKFWFYRLPVLVFQETELVFSDFIGMPLCDFFIPSVLWWSPMQNHSNHLNTQIHFKGFKTVKAKFSTYQLKSPKSKPQIPRSRIHIRLGNMRSIKC